MIDPKKKLDRFLMFIPGFSSWVMIFMPIWLGLTSPRSAAFVLTFLAVYWVYLSVIHVFNLFKGYYRYEREVKIDWLQRIKALDYKNLPGKETLPDSFEKTKHFILIPTVKEGYSILKDTFEALINSNYPKENMIIIVGTEEIGKEIVENALAQVKETFGNKLPRIMHFIHPRGLPGEIVGVASPNRKWATV